jgi:hypothetical protein
MNISYDVPLSKAWERMKKILFAKPFDLNKWFIIGFSAFLAGLLNGSWSYSKSIEKYRNEWDLSGIDSFFRNIQEWFLDHPLWIWVTLVSAIVIIGLLVLFTWLSSRGKFMFLDNVVRNRAEISRPWNEYRKEGNSLFLWRLAFGVIITAVITLLFVTFLFIFLPGLEDLDVSGVILRVAGVSIIFFLTLIVIAYIRLFLEGFIVPLMYRDRLTATVAWRKFLPLMKKYFWHFVLFGLFYMVLGILVAIVIIVFALVTCCVGLIILAIPYIGSVVMLPVSVTFRSFSVYFLEQFGDEFRVFPQNEGAATDTPAVEKQ